MGTFTPAGFTFGDSIVKERMQKQQIQAEMERASQQAAVQLASQKRYADAEDARLKEGARQFDARMGEEAARRASEDERRAAELAERGAAREEGARQFDERMSREDQKREDELADKKHKQSWDDKLNEQKLAGLQQEFDKRNVELERLMAIRQKEDEERAHQQELIESAYGDAIIVAELGGGFLSPKQVEDFNSRNGTNYNYVGKVDPTTGKPFEDGKLHFLTYQLDENGQVVMDEQSGRPMLTTDNPISAEFYGRVMDGYFGKFKDVMGKGGITYEQRKTLQDLKQEAIDNRQDKAIKSRERLAQQRGIIDQIKALSKDPYTNKDEIAKLTSQLESFLPQEEEEEQEPVQDQEPAEKKIKRIIKTAKDKDGNVWNLVEFEDGTKGEVRAE